MNWRFWDRGAQAASSTPRDPSNDFWFSDIVGGAVPAGVSVTARSALQLPIVMDCLKVLTQPIASLPAAVFQRMEDGSKKRAPQHPVHTLLTKRPNARQTPYEFRGQMMWNLAFHKNAYAEIVPGRFGPIGELLPIHPSRVRPELVGDDIWFHVRDPKGARVRKLHESEMWHLKAPPYTEDGITGMAIVETSRNAIGKAIAVNDYGARFFANGAISGGIIKQAGTFETDEQRDQFMASWRRARTGVNAHKDVLLEFDLDYEASSAKNNEAQFIETEKNADLGVARIWNIPPSEVGILEGAKFRNVEQAALAFIMKTMLPWLVLWEQRVEHDLIVPSLARPGEFFFEFNAAGLLRGDLKSRYDAYQVGRQGGWLSVNEIRKLENLNPIEGGDAFLEPLNMTPVGEGPKPDPGDDDDDDDENEDRPGAAVVSLREQA